MVFLKKILILHKFIESNPKVMNTKNLNLKKFLPHIVAILVFIALSLVYFNPQLKGYALRASDTETFIGMSKEIADFRQQNGEDPLWTAAMFSGMPAYQISVNHSMNLIKQIQDILIFKILGHPASLMFLAMLGFYIMLLCFGINPWLSIIGAIGFGFSTINLLYLGAGHNSRVHAIALMPPIIGGIYYTYRKKILLGAALTALFVALHVTANHLQETYYLLFLIFAIVLVELLRSVKEKALPKFLKASGFLAIAAFLGVLPTMSNLITTNEYSKFTTRGKSELTITLGEEPSEKTTGLDRWYIKQYNFGQGEVWSLLIPNVKGGASGYLGMHQDKIKNHVDSRYYEGVSRQSSYWGEQRFTGGAFYFGAVVFLLFFLGLFFVKDNLKYAFAVVGALAIVLSWKDSAILDFFIDKVPLFNKFRDSKIILVLLQLIFPLLGLMFVDRMMKKDIPFKKVLYVSGGLVLLLGLFYIAPRMWFNFLSQAENTQIAEQMSSVPAQQLAQFEDYRNNIENARIAIFRSDVLRTLVYLVIAIAFILLYLKKKIKNAVFITAIALLVLIDLWAVNKRYLNNDKERGVYNNWIERYKKYNPFRATLADKAILQNEIALNPKLVEEIQTATQENKKSSSFNQKYKEIEQEKVAFMCLNTQTNYRVFTLDNPFNSSRESYYHKSIGGYHGAKLRNYQELIEARINKEYQQIITVLQNNPTDSIINSLMERSMPTLNMLNTKYIIYNAQAQPLVNKYNNGNAWFVQRILPVENADSEILSLDSIDPKTTAVINKSLFGSVNLDFSFDTAATITMTAYAPNRIAYEFNASKPQFTVFSEIYYPKGWNVYIDGVKSSYMRANYVLRAMLIPKGKHEVVFAFEPSTFKTGNTVSFAGSMLLLLFLGFAIYREFKIKKNAQNKTQV